MQNETYNPLTTITGTTNGLLAGMYQTVNGSSPLNIMFTTALTAAVSCIVSFLIQQLLQRFKR